jgi:phospholipid/cholesterol/gamma-HCH transport system substrate-binding protein
VLSENSDQIGALIGDANALAQKLNKVGDDIDKLVARVSGLVETDGAGFLADARQAAATFREMAADLNARLDTMTEGIDRATGRSVREFESFLVEGQAAFRKVQNLIDLMQRNPQRFFSGGSQVPEYRAR